MDELDVVYDKLDLQVARMIATSKKPVDTLLKPVMKGVVRQVIAITPPSYQLKKVNAEGEDNSDVVVGLDAKKHGMAVVAADIRSLYGTPDQAYDKVKYNLSEPMAKGFWKHQKRGEFQRAADILGYAGQQLYPFDWGVVHDRQRNSRGRVNRKKTPVFYVQNERELIEYIKARQAYVGWLAGGWNAACAALNIRPPAWIWKQETPGSITIESSGTRFSICATNAAGFASKITDLERRIQWALDAQADAMKRRTDDFLYKNAQAAGFKVAA